MNNSDLRSSNQSPQQKFSKLNNSQQLIPEEILPPTLVSINPSPRREAYKKGIKKTLYLKDSERKKTICCHIYTNEMNAAQLALSKKGVYCRICMNDEETSRFIHPCKCSGSLKYVHEECFKMWVVQKNSIEKVLKDDIKCEVCQQHIVMKIRIQEQVQKSLYKDVHKHKKVCWLILLFLIILQISGAIVLGVLAKFDNVAIAAVITLLSVVALVLILYLIASIVQSLTIELIEHWSFSNYRTADGENKIGTVIHIQPAPQLQVSPRSPARSARQRRQSCAPSFGGLQVIQFSQYPSDI